MHYLDRLRDQPQILPAIYTRISDDRGDDNHRGLGVARQETDCRELCERKGWPNPVVFTDNDISASSNTHRPGYAALVHAIRTGQVNAVAVWDVDRLTRKVRELEDWIDLCDAYSVELASVGGEIDLASPQGRLVARIKGVVARHEAEAMSRRIRRKMLQNALEGKRGPGGVRPFGFEADKVTVRESEAILIREATDRIIAGEAMRSVVKDWMDRDIRTSTGRPFTHQSLRQLLQAGRIAGLRDHHRRPVAKAEWPAIITEEQRTALVHVLGEDWRRSTTPAKARKYVLSGFVYCAKCGHKLTATTRKWTRKTDGEVTVYPTYVCPAKYDGGCGGIAVGIDWLDELVTAALLARVQRVGRSGKAEERARARRVAAQARVVELEERLAGLGREYAAASGAMLVALRAAVDEVEDQLTTARRDATPPARPLAGEGLDKAGLRARWEGMTLLEKREVVAAYLARIDVAPIGTGRKNTPDRLTLQWVDRKPA